MKQRFLAIVLLLAMLLVNVCGCVPISDTETTAPSELATQEPTAEPTETAEEPTESIEESTESTEELTESIEEPTESIEEPTESSEEPTESSEEPTESSEEPTESIEEPAESSKEPTESSEDPTESSEDPAESSEDLTEPIEEPTESTEEPAESSNPVIDPEPIQYAQLKDLTDYITDFDNFPNGTELLEVIAQAPVMPLELLPATDRMYEIGYFPGFLPWLENGNFVTLYSEWRRIGGIGGVFALDDTHVCSVRRMYYAPEKLHKYFYAVYELEEKSGEWVYTTEYYVASKALSSSDFADVKIGDSFEKVRDIEPAIRMVFSDKFEVPLGTPALLLEDGVLFFRFDGNYTVSFMKFYAYGEDVVYESHPLSILKAEDPPPLPIWG